MAKAHDDNCGNCAYVDKSGNRYWCPFHDAPVSDRNICDDYLAEYEAPQWASLVAGMNANGKKTPQYLPKDIFMYVVTFVLWALNVAFILLCCFAPL